MKNYAIVVRDTWLERKNKLTGSSGVRSPNYAIVTRDTWFERKARDHEDLAAFVEELCDSGPRYVVRRGEATGSSDVQNLNLCDCDPGYVTRDAWRERRRDHGVVGGVRNELCDRDPGCVAWRKENLGT